MVRRSARAADQQSRAATGRYRKATPGAPHTEDPDPDPDT